MASRRRFPLQVSCPRTTIAAALACHLTCILLLAGSVYALDPNKRITQYIHTSWQMRDGSAPGSPAKLSFTHLSVADGLSNADVRAIAQDHQGFMWFGTWLGGLNRYDGYTFKVYKHDDQDGHSLATDTVQKLYVDRAGVLWVGTMGGGLDRYDRETDSFTHFRHNPNDLNSLPDNNVNTFGEDENGVLWVGTHAGLSRFDRASGKFFTYTANPNDPASHGQIKVQALALDAATGLAVVYCESGSAEGI